MFDTNLLPLTTGARVLRVPSAWLRTELETGRLPGVPTGDGWLVHLPTLVRLLEKRAARGERAVKAKGGTAHA